VELLVSALSWILLIGGAAFVLIGGIGVVRMPNLYTRIHAAGLTDSLGPILVLGGLMLQVGNAQELFKLAAILLFMMITGPTATYALANAALMAGVDTDLANRNGRENPQTDSRTNSGSDEAEQ